MAQQVGSVVWFNNGKGYGFLKTSSGADVFCHYTSILTENRYRSLNLGDIVEFDIEEGAQGPQAANVRKLKGDSDA